MPARYEFSARDLGGSACLPYSQSQSHNHNGPYFMLITFKEKTSKCHQNHLASLWNSKYGRASQMPTGSSLESDQMKDYQIAYFHQR